jgi:hypothetical protein
MKLLELFQNLDQMPLLTTTSNTIDLSCSAVVDKEKKDLIQYSHLIGLLKNGNNLIQKMLKIAHGNELIMFLKLLESIL